MLFVTSSDLALGVNDGPMEGRFTANEVSHLFDALVRGVGTFLECLAGFEVFDKPAEPLGNGFHFEPVLFRLKPRPRVKLLVGNLFEDVGDPGHFPQ
jgi:hypothetical protein